jgi:CDP-diacylglycerol--glycerol-3-phosphate 3-phosphatidyltransferase
MISLYKIKPAFQNLLHPILKLLHKRHITANQITIVAVLLSFIMGTGFFFYHDYPILLLLIPFGYLLRMVLNALDGMMATEYNMKSKLGEILNELGDVISDIAIIIPMVLIPKMNLWVIISFAFLAVLNEFSGVLAKSVRGKRHYEGPMGKSDRALLIGLYCIVYFFWTDLENYSNWIFSIGSILIVISTITRLKNALK